MEKTNLPKYVFVDFITTTKEYMPFWYIEEFAIGHINSLHPVAMGQQMIDFVRTYCRCSYCYKSVNQFLARCSCGKQVYQRIHVEFPTKIFETIFIPIYGRQRTVECYTRKARSRKRKLLGSGKYTNQEIDWLMLIQENRCYYCATSLSNEDGKQNFHIDHYVSLTEGGRNEISNLVLACPTCNLGKGIDEGSRFIYRMSKSLSLEMREKAKSIRRRVKAHKKKLISNK